ncbi:MAG: hypothetical protein AAB354_02835 [candidate division KSB1 bacterium]
MTETLHYYILLGLFTLLFLLQVWAIVRIRQMIRRVLAIYDHMQALRGEPRGLHQAAIAAHEKSKRSCQVCRHRQTFLDPSGKQVFLYRCGITQERITLDYYCEKFEFDAQSADT